tara:strand:+ start:419 stop:1573 length:1155 start_codon:yes stop_codon:yes gene_type:complete
MIYKRALKLPPTSFFLFGPRGAGKTTWLKKLLPEAKWFDLLNTKTYFKLLREPSLLRMEVEALPEGAWIVIDEVQKLTILLDEVHRLISDYENKYFFALSGSSARKLKRLDANLLAGRVINRNFFPMTGTELNFNFDPESLLRYGCLPKVCAEPDLAIDILEAYVGNYLKEEIQQEAFVKDFGSFSRFLEIAALCNGQVTNVSNIARDAGVARPTVQRYFDVLDTTLIGCWLPAWRTRAKVKESAHPKFFFFDTGVVRALSGLLRDSVEKSEKGPLLETLVLHELRSAQNNLQVGGKFYYWRTPSGSEVDFIWTRGKKTVGIEVKSSVQYRREYCKTLKNLIEEGPIQKGFLVYLGESVLKDGPVSVLPLKKFMAELSAGRIII